MATELQKDTKMDEPTYWQALGQFIETYAHTEAVLFETLASYTDIPIEVARAVFSGVRTDASMDFIRRIIAVNGLETEKHTDPGELFEHLKFITDLRNHVVHYRSFLTDDSVRMASNITRALSPEKIKELRVSAEILGKATHDLEKIYAQLGMDILAPMLSLAQRARHLPVLNDAWLYKPPPNPQKKVRKSSRKDRN